MAFDKDIPAINQDASTIGASLRANFAAIQNGGFMTAASEPTYKVEGTPWWDSANNLFKLYDGSAWQTCLLVSTGLRAQGASYKVDSGVASCVKNNVANAVSFNFTFSAAPKIFCSFADNPSIDSTTIYVSAVTTTGFNIHWRGYGNDGTSPTNINWFAIGTAA